MSAVEIVHELRQAGAVIEARGTRIHIEAPRGLLTAERRELLRRHKRELLDWLARQDDPAPGRRIVIEYRIPESEGRWLTLLGAPGESYASAVDGLRRRYGERLIEARPYAGGTN